VALVGYTNAGKSTLFHAATGADVFIADQLFATLDPTVRRLKLPGGANIVLADTVGFIRELPHELVAAFQSTLTEARNAQLLLHVIDARDDRRDEYIEQVNAVLNDIGAGDLPQLRVYNKIDRLGVEPRIERNDQGVITQVWISAAHSKGLGLLFPAMAERLQLQALRRWIQVPAPAGAVRAQLHAARAVRDERAMDDGSIWLLVDMPDSELAPLQRRAGVLISACAPDKGYLESTASKRPSDAPV
jgi:GTP-binding protein HflX